MFRWRRPYRDWLRFMWYPLVLALPGAVVLAVLTDGWPPGRFAWQVPLSVGIATAALWRFTLVGVLLNGDRIKVRTLFRTRILYWDDVAEVGRGKFDLRLHFILRSGEHVNTVVTTTTYAGYEAYLTQRQFQRLVDRLRERLD